MTKAQLQGVMSRSDVDMKDAMAKAAPIVQDVRERGDVALRKYARRLDGYKGMSLEISRSEIRGARKRLPKELMQALEASKRRIEAFHSRQKLYEFEYSDEAGIYGQRVVPLRRIGVYVPGGTADYFSSVLMACVPARLAGVEQICLCTPGRNGRVTDAVLAAASLCDVREVRPVGGAHAISAMAYGTESVPRVQKIVGPGGAVVTAAKLLVRNDCEIDFLAGPSEVLIIADASADPALVVSEMLAQLEHDPLARAVLVSDSGSLLEQVRAELESRIPGEGRSDIISSAAKEGAIFIRVEDIQEAVAFSNRYAPEHLLIDVRRPMTLLKEIENAGSVFIGSRSSVAFGDYCSGTNHILPTKGMASMRSALSVYDFLKIVPYQSISANGARMLAGTVRVMSMAEGLPAHARAALARAGKVRT